MRGSILFLCCLFCILREIHAQTGQPDVYPDNNQCTFNNVGDGNNIGAFTDCVFTACGGTYTLSQCGGDGSYCSSNSALEVVGGSVLNTQHSGCGSCDSITFDVADSCASYRVRQSCTDTGSCNGVTSITFTTPEPSSAPTSAAFDTNPGQMCDAFTLPNDNTYRGCLFNPEGVVNLVMCGVDQPAPFQTANCMGVYFDGIYDREGTRIVMGPETTSNSCGCPEMTYDFTNNISNGPYEIRHRCSMAYSSGCSGQTAIYSLDAWITPSPTLDPTVDPTVYPTDAPTATPTMASDIGDYMPGGLCGEYAIGDGTNDYASCFFSTSSPGYVVISQCQDDKPQNVNTGSDSAMCTGNTRLQLVVAGTSQILVDTSGGASCGGGQCTKLEYTITESVGSYEVRQFCFGGGGCTGRTGIWNIGPLSQDPSVSPTISPTEAPTDAPTEAPSDFPTYEPTGSTDIGDANPGGTCGEFAMASGGGYASCFFSTSSTGNVIISMCNDDRPPNAPGEVAYCSGTTRLAVVLQGGDGTELASDSGSAACSTFGAQCSMIVLPITTGGSSYFEVRQYCGGRLYDLCSGRTGIWWASDPSATPTEVNLSTESPTDEPSYPSPDPTIMPTRVPTIVPTLQAVNFHAPTYKVKNGFAFAARAADGSVHTWGEAPFGGDSSAASFGANVTSIVASRFAYVAVNSDNTFTPWGVSSATTGNTVGVVRGLVANEAAFAGILTATNGVVALGSKHNGGNVTSDLRCNGFKDELSSGVQSITAAACAFTALKTDGTVYSWGNVHCGAGVSSVSNTALVGVQKVVATREAFAALLSTGAVKVWGGSHAGGDATLTGTALNSGVVDIIAAREVFVAVKSGGGLVTWGYGPYGGDASAVQSYINSGVTSVAQTFTAFAALKSNGDVYTWGRAASGGDSSAVATSLHNIVSIHGAGKAFAAINSTGGVVAWGKAAYGGVIPLDKLHALSSNVASIYSTDRAFLALKQDGSVVVWGQAGHGGSPGAYVEGLLAAKPVHTVCSNDAAFSAINTDGAVIGWGHPVSVAVPGIIFTDNSLKTLAKCD